MRRTFLKSVAGLFAGRIFAQPNIRKKFYITGMHYGSESNDCTVPPVVAYGKDRTDALLRCCEGGGLTVWTESEWDDFQKQSGKQFRDGCKLAGRKE